MDIDTNNNENDKKNEEERIKEQLYKEYIALFNQFTGSSQRLNPDLIEGKKKLISCRHEIVFNINARVMEEDELGNAVATTAICTKNYHIPVPSDKDYNVYMKSFFEYLESCLSKSAQYSKKENSDG
jgi:hypothetical protein